METSDGYNTVWERRSPLQEDSSCALADGIENIEDIEVYDREYMLKHDKDGFNHLQRAAQNGELDSLKKFLHIAPDAINSQAINWKRTALHMAAEGGHLEIVTFLVNSGAELNLQDKFGYTPLSLALARCHWRPPLNSADIAENNEVACYLIEAGAELKIRDYTDKTALDHAVKSNLETVIDALRAKDPSLAE